MIASIVPIKRLPRFSSIFDYAIPPDLESIAMPGQLVIIEFRKKKEFGVIVKISEKQNTEYSYKLLDSIVHPTPLFSEKHQQLLHELSVLYAVSLATLYKTSILPLQKRKLKKLELVPDTTTRSTSSFSESYFLYTNQQEHRLLFSDLPKFHTTLVLIPEISKLEETERSLKEHSTAPIVIWRSDLSIKEKYDVWLQIRNNKAPLIILGTRSSVTLPFSRLDHIIMDFEHDEQYKNYDQQPKFHTFDLVRMIGRVYESTIVYASFTPSLERYYSILKEKLPCSIGASTYHSGLLFAPEDISGSVRIIEHTSRSQENRICSIAIEDSIMSLARKRTGDAVVLVQRKGYATMIICKDCGHIETSQASGLPMIYREDTRMMYAPYDREVRPLPLVCSSCRSTKLQLQGIGTERVASFFSTLLKKENSLMQVFRIDDNTDTTTFEKLASDTPRLLIGTEKILPYIRHDKTNVYAILDLDRYLAVPEYSALEHVIHLIDEINYYRIPDSELLLETVSSDKNVFKLFSERDRVYRTELSLRQKLGYPPYQSMIKYTISSFSKTSVRTLAQHFRNDLALRLTQLNIPATLSEIYETHPNFDKGKYWYGVVLKTNSSYLKKIAASIHTNLPRECVVDIHPLSVLSP